MATEGIFHPDFKYEVAARPGAENIQACFTCGVCTAGCPVSEIDERYNPRKMVRMLLWGMKEELLSGDLIWLCNRCYTCYAHCPQNVKFTDVIGVLRRMAVQEGYVTSAVGNSVEEIDRLIQEVRRDMVTGVLSDEDPELSLKDLLLRVSTRKREEGS